MLIIEPPSRLADHAGHTVGPGDWLTVDQAMIDAFAELTGDRQWIHVDTERAVEPVPGGRKCVTETSIEVEGQSKPALVAESIFLYYD